MKRVLNLALNDLRLTVRDRPAFLWMLLLPLAMMWFFGSVFGPGQSGPPSIALDVVSHDPGWLARAFVDELRDERIELRERTPAQAAAAQDRVRTLVIPAGFTRGVIAGERQVLRLEREPGSSAEFGIAAQAHVLRAIVRTLAGVIELAEQGVSAEREAELERWRALAARPDLVRLAVAQAGNGRPVPAGRAQSVPGILTMSVLMMTSIYGGVFLTLEKASGMVRRQATLPLGRVQLLAGKLLGRVLIAALQVVMLVLSGRFLLGVSWGDSPLGLVLLLASYTLAVAGLATLLGAVLDTPAQASSVGWIGAMVMAAIGGCWWPAEVMPRWLQSAAHLLPTTWAMDGFHALISFGRGVEAVLLPAAVLLGFGALFVLAGARFLRLG
jgi:ABC-type multidrug transport system permease subunit